MVLNKIKCTTREVPEVGVKLKTNRPRIISNPEVKKGKKEGKGGKRKGREGKGGEGRGRKGRDRCESTENKVFMYSMSFFFFVFFPINKMMDK